MWAVGRGFKGGRAVLAGALLSSILVLGLLLTGPVAAQDHGGGDVHGEAGHGAAQTGESVQAHGDSLEGAAHLSEGRAADHAAADEGHGAAHGEDVHGAAHGEEAHGGHRELGAILPLWTAIPFAGILLSIALGPLLAPHFWHRHFPKVSAFWALAFAVPFLVAFKGEALYEILHIYIIDYIPFIILLGALFSASGGILLRGTLAGTPKVNLILLIIGTLLASWIGTTGASMLLIRPILRSNANRRSRLHIVVFFIFLVSNIGGSLTPLGDPPLFLGFLHGVPFFWTFHLFPHMLFVSAILLIAFFIWDTVLYRREKAELPPVVRSEPLRLEGAHNFLFLLGILGGVILSGTWRPGTVNILGVHQGIQNLVRDGILLAMAVLAYVTTREQTRKDNEFTWFPIKEVAYIFAGIFMTIIPALAILRAGEHGALAGLIAAVQEPWQYFWVTGALSSFLDNAPTYLTFFNSALGSFHPGQPEAVGVGHLISDQKLWLEAIAAGAVFMGANTYIGNAPNFMVRSIAEEAGVPMPSFFGYMLRFSIPILIPAFILVTLVFFR